MATSKSADPHVQTPYVPAAPYQQFVGGEFVPTTRRFPAIDPSVGEMWAELPQGTADDVDAAVAAARLSGTSWGRSSLDVRQEVLLAIADRFIAHGEQFALLLATANGRTIREARMADIPTVASIFRFFGGVVRASHGAQIPVADPHTLVYTKREPLGVIAAVLPWNSPLITLANKMAPALAGGNTLVIKPSEYATASVLEFVTLVADILPAGVVNVVTGTGGETGRALVSHPDVAKISFTGGPETARSILMSAAATLRPTVMELGGKGALIVTEDADLDAAVHDALLGIYLANGESCIASSRILVNESVHDEFVGRFVEVAKSIKVGDAKDPASEMGPLVSERQFGLVRAHIENARSEGFLPLTGTEPLGLADHLQGGYFQRPVMLSDPEGTSTITRTEVFGPVAVVERYRTDEEAVTRANSTRYGLAAGVWTRDLARAHRMAAELRAGIVWVNKWFDLSPGMPMGGVGDSGFGRELSVETLDEYTVTKAVNIGLDNSRPTLWGLG